MKNDNIIVKIDEDNLKVNDVDKLLELLDSLKPTAKDMFKMLGWIPNPYQRGMNEDGWLMYVREKEHRQRRAFTKSISFYKNKVLFDNVPNLKISEIVAINKQIEELGW